MIIAHLTGAYSTKGKPGPNPKNEAKKWAERMGYHWIGKTDPSVRFDGFLYRDSVITAVKMKKMRYGFDDHCAIETKLPDDVADLRNLPLPHHVLREL